MPPTIARPKPTTKISALIILGPLETRDVFRTIINGNNMICMQIIAPTRAIENAAIFFSTDTSFSMALGRLNIRILKAFYYFIDSMSSLIPTGPEYRKHFHTDN